MTIKVKARPGKKAIVRFNDKKDEDFFFYIMVRARDTIGDHPRISVEDLNGFEMKIK